MSEPRVPEPAFSTAFDRLVGDHDTEIDIVGLLAYALYKRDKRELAVSKAVDDQMLRQHYKTLTSGLQSQYRDSALRLLEDYSNAVVSRAEPEIMAGARIAQIESAKADIVSEVKSSTAAWKSIVWNVIAWLVSLAIAFLVTIGSGKVSLQING